MQCTWAPPGYQPVLGTSTPRPTSWLTAKPHQVLEVIDAPGSDGERIPFVIRGPDLERSEFTALTMKLNMGTQVAATYLQRMGYTLEQARELLCVRGRYIQ